jgi:uncharacterized protein
MKVVSNTSPLIGFAKIQRLSLLQQLFQSIVIPSAVYDEFFENCTASEEKHFRSACDEFVRVVSVHSSHTFSRRLDQGEQEVLTLALQMHADLVLLDDRKAWNEARELQLMVASTRAVLTIAEERNLIQSYQEIEVALRQQQFYPPSY